MLRVNADGSIPADNPFYLTASGPNRAIWAYGLRNPFRFAVNPGGPAPTMLINDVGGSSFEEINDGVRGANYGYPGSEGYTPFPESQSPRYAYDHSGGACAIIGGAFYTAGAGGYPAGTSTPTSSPISAAASFAASIRPMATPCRSSPPAWPPPSNCGCTTARSTTCRSTTVRCIASTTA